MDTGELWTNTWERGITDNCGGHNCIYNYELTFWDKLRAISLIILIHLGIIIVISFLITLGFYLVYKHKGNENPWKYAIKKSWPRWIVAFLISLILGVILFSMFI